MHGDDRIDKIAPQRAEPRLYPILVLAGKPAVSDPMRKQYRREFPILSHGRSPPQATLAKTRSTGPMPRQRVLSVIRRCTPIDSLGAKSTPEAESSRSIAALSSSASA